MFNGIRLYFLITAYVQSNLYDQCSGGKLKFLPTQHSDLVNGVLELSTSESLAGLGISKLFCTPSVFYTALLWPKFRS